MNYGKENLEKRKKKISSKKNMKKKRVGVRFFKALIICILILAVVGVGGVGLFAKRIIDNTPTVTPADVKPQGFTSFVYAEDGTLLEQFLESGSNRVYKTIDEIPKYLGDAFVAIEDERFYKHNGIDLQGILRAGIVGITSGNFSEGASTLTQQLIKNNVFPNFLDEKTFYDRLERTSGAGSRNGNRKADDQRRDSGSLYEHDQPRTELPRRAVCRQTIFRKRRFRIDFVGMYRDRGHHTESDRI